MVEPIKFSLIGGGFRAQFYLRIAQALPEQFVVSGMVVRDEIKGKKMENQWNVVTYRTMDELLQNESPNFTVLCVNRKASLDYLFDLAHREIPVLAETPPAPDLNGLIAISELLKRGAKIQVAEQYVFQPMHAAYLKVIESGRLGNVNEATVSVSHAYHGISMIRKMLGIGCEKAKIQAMRFQSPWISGPNRKGPPETEKIEMSKRDIAWIRFGDKLGIYDFTKDQHRSWIRSNSISLRGERGEIFDDQLNVLEDYKTPLHLDFKRVNKGEQGNLEGYFLDGIIAGEKWVYKNPFAPARLFDDEIAIATCLIKMADYISGGSEFYSLAEAAQDHYLGLLVEQAIATESVVISAKQPWHEYMKHKILSNNSSL
ncbi:Gfo/Idh/MocA family protein [Chengkuizengella axinellae]|uniref:Gfo/Idh/MocA family oxidoreductase n=1 Tax=Chengkuizengella axinellae TaxID=3064388 RepID=A0ABT9ITK5_9BACL|nr:Gfo/Idh/MocA family oxidoreductase [Chengkuizengella sp. 2205SS18-9]MDP5272617.1 Gfo/Idh/MocA family oxidoreductase [Chengkuizengella sp. 2205SS18-9]